MLSERGGAWEIRCLHKRGLSQYPGLLDRVHSFLRRGHEYCLALASKEALTTVAQITDRENAQSVADTGTMKVAELKNTLRQRSLRLSGRKAQLVLRLTASCLPSRSVWYFMSTMGLCGYAKDSLQLRNDNYYPHLGMLMNKAPGRGLLPGVQMLRRLGEHVSWTGHDCTMNAVPAQVLLHKCQI